MNRDDAASALADYFRNSINHNNDYEWLSFHGLSIESASCGLAMCFYQGKLQSIHFGLAISSSDTTDGWPTREMIDAEVSFMRGILSRSFSRSFSMGQESFPWGTIWSGFDPKGFQASSGIRYAP